MQCSNAPSCRDWKPVFDSFKLSVPSVRLTGNSPLQIQSELNSHTMRTRVNSKIQLFKLEIATSKVYFCMLFVTTRSARTGPRAGYSTPAREVFPPFFCQQRVPCTDLALRARACAKDMRSSASTGLCRAASRCDGRCLVELTFDKYASLHHSIKAKIPSFSP